MYDISLLPAAEKGEISFINDVTSTGTIAATAFWTWGYDNPATYPYTFAAKWGGDSTGAQIGAAAGTITYAFDVASGWSDLEKSVFVKCLTLWSDLANVKFAVAASPATAQMSFTRGADGSAYEQVFSESAAGGAVGTTTMHNLEKVGISIDTSVPGFGPLTGDFDAFGGYVFQTIVHELGHALGLGHGGPYNGYVDPDTQQYSAYDTRLWSVMSYIDPDTPGKYSNQYPVTGTHWGNNAIGYYREPTTPMALDILAIQQLYGAPVTTAFNGGQVFGFNCNITDAAKAFFDFTVNQHPVVTIYDQGANNTLDLSGFSVASSVSLFDGTFSSTSGMTNNLCIAYGTVINTAIGGSANDTLKANNNGDRLDGRLGADTFIGGLGNDTFIVDNIGDTVTEAAGGGTDLVKSTASAFTLAAQVENLTLTGAGNINGTGNSLANSLVGNTGANVLDGAGGNDTLRGDQGDDVLNGGTGADRLSGNAGNDTYYIDSTGDHIYEYTTAGIDDGGHDLVVSSISFTLGVFQEDLTLTSTASAGYGNDLNNLLRGNASSNKLDGGLGADTMLGGAGSDYYYVDNIGDVVSEQSTPGIDDGGTDRVTSTIDYVLGTFLENLYLIGSTAIIATGNNLANIIIGDSANNRITGGAGGDILTGGAGSDTFVFAHFGAANGNDHLRDFVTGTDHLSLTAADYGWLPGHVLTPAELSLTGVAVGTTKQFVYDPTTHQLYWDSNGSNAGGSVALAAFDNAATPHTGDFLFT